MSRMGWKIGVIALLSMLIAGPLAGHALATENLPEALETDPGIGQEEGVSKLVEGELVAIDGEFYVLKGPNGEEVRLHVSKQTEIIGDIHIGDLVEAEVLPNGHALLIGNLRT